MTNNHRRSLWITSILAFIITRKSLAAPTERHQNDEWSIFEISTCEFDLTEPRAYQSFSTDLPTMCNIKIRVPRGQGVQVKLVDELGTCLLSTQSQQSPITIREEPNNRSMHPCLEDREPIFFAESGPVTIQYLASIRPFLFSIRFFKIDIECGDKVEFVQFKHPLRLHTRGKEICHIFLPGSSTLTLVDFDHSGDKCAANVSIGVGDHIAEIAYRTKPICSIDGTRAKVDIYCGAGRIEILSDPGIKSTLTFAIKILDTRKYSALDLYERKMKMCDR